MTPTTTENFRNAFRFLSATQVLQMRALAARQLLPTQEHPRSVADDEALIFVFVSHRWDEKANPDKNGKQLKALQTVLTWLKDLLSASFGAALAWPQEIDQLLEGMPQAASLVSRIQKAVKNNESKSAMMKSNPLDHIWLWYDCSCLPQHLDHRKKTPEEKVEFQNALLHLDWLVSQSEVLCLRSDDDDYEERAWCSFECFQKSVSHFEGYMMMNIDKVERGERVEEWFVKDTNPEWYKKTIQQPQSYPMFRQLDEQLGKSLENYNKIMSNASGAIAQSREATYEKLNTTWKELVDNSTGGAASVDLTVPDLCENMQAIRRTNLKIPKDLPFQMALEATVRELQSAVFSMSCRDAAALADIPIAPEHNSCIANVGIQCGLHEGHELRTVEEQRAILDQADASLRAPCFERESDETQLRCKNGHSLEPDIAGESFRCDVDSCQLDQKTIPTESVVASCKECNYDQCFGCSVSSEEAESLPWSSDAALNLMMTKCCVKFPPPRDVASNIADAMCERRVTIDLYSLLRSMLHRYGQKCTNAADTAYVGLLALRHLLSGPGRKKNSYQIYCGPLKFLYPAIAKAVELSTELTSQDEEVESLQVEIVFRVPKWVLLDMANAQITFAATLLHSEGLVISSEAEAYLQENPGSISFSYDGSMSQPIQRRESCRFQQACPYSWTTCEHVYQGQAYQLLASLQSPSSLDAWTTTRCPSPVAFFASVVTEDHVFIIGGLEEHDEMLQPPPVATVRRATLPFSCNTDVMWTNLSSLSQARRSHAACLRKDENGLPLSIWVSGGIGLDDSEDDEPPRLDTVEVLNLSDPKASWISGPSIPRTRSSHGMVCVDGCLFVYCGRTGDGLNIVDIFNFRNDLWLEGPELPLPLRGSGSAVIQDRYLLVLGGVDDEAPVLRSWVLDTKPWAEWSSKGGNSQERPTSSWMDGPPLPEANGWPNICAAEKSETNQLYGDWVLSVAPSLRGNLCYGFCVVLPIKEDDSSHWSRLRWFQLGATPDATRGGNCVVTNDGTLAIIGGKGCSDENTWSNRIHFRRLIGTMPMPLPLSYSSSGMPDAENLRICLNDHYLLGRLGVPITEEALFSFEGTKRIRLLPPKGDTNVHCHHCLVSKKSLDGSRSGGATRFGFRSSARSRCVPVCSQCFYCLYLQSSYGSTGDEEG